ncbi:tetratricopeptide repeat protein [Fontivita pretiosa]|uniref:tetratricopeptide repeat protein n=1 Tax=Fontivita pretiosa TaxID=2989684 RepID=UPI003D16E64F
MNRSGRRAVLLFAAIGAILVASTFADQGVVRTRDGQTYQGDVTVGNEVVRIRLHGVETILQKADVESIELKSDYEADFRQRLSKLDEKDVAGRIALAREAFDRRRYDLAREALENALSVDPNSREATDMLRLVQRQIELERDRAATAGEATVAAGAAPSTPSSRLPPTPVHSGDRRLLTPADVEVIRRKELKPGDSGVRISIDPAVRKRFAESQNMTLAEFNAKPPVQQALEIFEKGDPDMQQRVRIASDPPAILEFRRQIQPMVLQNCATAACHGGSAGGSLILYSPADNDLVTYTNFYILMTWEKPIADTGGVFGNSAKRLIERGRGEQSLLANFGLPINIAEYDHPLVGGKPIQPMFRNKDDPKYRALVEWMNRSLSPIQPDYGINYTPPTGQSLVHVAGQTTQPATQQGEPVMSAPGQPALPP